MGLWMDQHPEPAFITCPLTGTDETVWHMTVGGMTDMLPLDLTAPTLQGETTEELNGDTISWNHTLTPGEPSE